MKSALVGAMIASGVTWREMVPLVFDLRRQEIARVKPRSVLINGIRQESLFQGEPLRAYIARILPATRWEDISMPFQVNAVDLETGLTDWFGVGARTDASLADAVYAPAALPVFYPPVQIGSQVFVDGGSGKESHPCRRLA